MTTRSTLDGSTTASGMGAAATAYKKLLFCLCKSGCTLPKISVVPGMLTTIIQFTVEGTDEELRIFSREFKG
jgi:hypothetical protein